MLGEKVTCIEYVGQLRAIDPPPLKWSDLRYKPEEIVAKLRQVDVLVSQGQNMVDAIVLASADEVIE